jgi:hypothetical protein
MARSCLQGVVVDPSRGNMLDVPTKSVNPPQVNNEVLPPVVPVRHSMLDCALVAGVKDLATGWPMRLMRRVDMLFVGVLFT